MRALAILGQSAVASLIASAAGGLLLVALAFVGLAVDFLQGSRSPAEIAAMLPGALAFLLAVGGVAVAGVGMLAFLPALALGLLLGAAATTRPWASARRAWAAAGAGIALGLWAWGQRRLDPDGLLEAMTGAHALLTAAVVLAGAGAGLVQRTAMGAVGPFFGIDEEEESGG